jgi:hypothetical protein
MDQGPSKFQLRIRQGALCIEDWRPGFQKIPALSFPVHSDPRRSPIFEFEEQGPSKREPDLLRKI